MKTNAKVHLLRFQSQLTLPSRTVHVWRTELDGRNGETAAFQVLSSDERTRALQFRFDRDRRRFTVTRATLRLLLSMYVAIPADQIVFVYGASGKPELISGGLQFNLSHSGELAVIAISANTPVGVDIEQLSRIIDCEALIASFASPRERDAFAALPQQDRRLAFFHWWTRKEAVIKATGVGHSQPLDSFDVPILFSDATMPVFWSIENELKLTLEDISLPSDYIGSLAISGEACSIEFGQTNGLDFFQRFSS